MSEYDRLLQAIAIITTDYRVGELAKPTAAHVDRWISQFPQPVRQPILTEMEHVLSKSYFNRNFVTQFLTGLATNAKLTGDDPKSFWLGVKFLEIQKYGSSQKDFLKLFGEILLAKFGIKIEDCGKNPQSYVYIDDILFSGGRIGSDLSNWVTVSAPAEAQVNVITIGYHRLGQWFAENDIDKAINASGKSIKLTWWRLIEIEDRKSRMTNSDVLRPTVIPADAATQAYVAGLGQAPILRTAGGVGALGLFSSDAGRILLEQEFLTAGVRIRQGSPLLNIYQRPLGNIRLKMVGFGSVMATYRNCPNNAPLVFWAGDPWYPLFKRKTN